MENVRDAEEPRTSGGEGCSRRNEEDVIEEKEQRVRVERCVVLKQSKI